MDNHLCKGCQTSTPFEAQLRSPQEAGEKLTEFGQGPLIGFPLEIDNFARVKERRWKLFTVKEPEHVEER